jgi:hypothetical protein
VSKDLKGIAKDNLSKEASMASTVFFSALEYFGPDLLDLEPETLRITVSKDKFTIPESNWDELFAALALRGDGRFMYDASVFENTVMAFNHDAVMPTVLQRALPAQIAWAVKEAGIMAKDMLEDKDADITDYFDYEVDGYTAAACIQEGLMEVPDSLAFCAETLAEMLNASNAPLAAEVKKEWMRVKGEVTEESLEKMDSESEVGSQVTHMLAIDLYVAQRMRILETQLATLHITL